jgi:hypothetical protein
MAEKTNVELWQEARGHFNRLGKIVMQYEKGKLMLADGVEQNIDEAKVTALKSAGAAERAACIAALQAITS